MRLAAGPAGGAEALPQTPQTEFDRQLETEKDKAVISEDRLMCGYAVTMLLCSHH